MARVEIIESLYEKIEKKFKKEAEKIFNLLNSLEKNPQKGKILGTISGLTVKELKYKSFRFYFITDGFKLNCLDEEALTDLLMKFVRMSDKKSQQKTINEIKRILQTIGPKGFK